MTHTWHTTHGKPRLSPARYRTLWMTWLSCIVTLWTPPLLRNKPVVSRDQPISTRYTPCILVSCIRSALPYSVHSCSHASYDGNQILRRKIPTHREYNPFSLHPDDDDRPITASGSDSTIVQQCNPLTYKIMCAINKVQHRNLKINCARVWYLFRP